MDNLFSKTTVEIYRLLQDESAAFNKLDEKVTGGMFQRQEITFPKGHQPTKGELIYKLRCLRDDYKAHERRYKKMLEEEQMRKIKTRYY